MGGIWMRRHRSRRLAAIALVLLFLFGGMGTATAENHEPVTIQLWTGTLISSAEMLKSEEDWWLTGALARFKELYPYVTVEVTQMAEGDTAAQLFRSASVTGSAPDIFEGWSGNWVIDLKDYAMPVYDVMDEDVRNTISGWETVSVDYDTSNTIVGVPTMFQGFGCLYYNKDIIAACGLDFENDPPKTTDELAKACQIIKDAGYTPIITDEGTGNKLFYFVALYWWVQQSGYSTMLAENAGEMKYAEDEGLLSFLEFYSDLFKNGFMNSDTLSSDDAMSRFMVGEGAMYPDYCSYVTTIAEEMGDALGIIKPGDMDPAGEITGKLIGGPGQAYVVSKDTQHPEECIALIEFLSSPEEFVELYKADSSKYPNIIGVDPTKLEGITPVSAKLVEWAGDATFWPDNVIDSDAITELIRYIPDLFNGIKTPLEVAEAMDAVIANK